MSRADATFDPATNRLTVGGRRLVFHCHHYNCFLQRSVEELLGDAAVALQVDAAAEAARHALEGVFEGVESFDARVELAAEVFRQNGFGVADRSGLTADGGTILLPTSHYAVGWRAKFGAPKGPVCHFATGFWRGALVAAAPCAPERVVAREERCAARTDGPCVIRLEVR